ncbi:hypothetical protein PQR05_29775 [Paraburkholderia sediminicola]|uniref:hypothetical protein n=1 Tax=Paraburkholderia sediminicola TaxID=458836 RepID=UPI0038B70301
MPNRIPLNPKLPKGFDQTPNEDRSKDQLDAWWDHPYGITRDDGKIDVRCLNGGAHDRSTWLGLADDYDAACALAEKKQADWLTFRERPTLIMDEKPALARMPQRPDESMEIIATFETTQEATAYIEQHYPK